MENPSDETKQDPKSNGSNHQPDLGSTGSTEDIIYNLENKDEESCGRQVKNGMASFASAFGDFVSECAENLKQRWENRPGYIKGEKQYGDMDSELHLIDIAVETDRESSGSDDHEDGLGDLESQKLAPSSEVEDTDPYAHDDYDSGDLHDRESTDEEDEEDHAEECGRTVREHISSAWNRTRDTTAPYCKKVTSAFNSFMSFFPCCKKVNMAKKTDTLSEDFREADESKAAAPPTRSQGPISMQQAWQQSRSI